MTLNRLGLELSVRGRRAGGPPALRACTGFLRAKSIWPGRGASLGYGISKSISTRRESLGFPYATAPRSTRLFA